MLAAPIALVLYATGTFSCWAAEQDRRFVVAFSKDESQYAIAKVLLQRFPAGEVRGTSFHCVHKIKDNALVKCGTVEQFSYDRFEGPAISFAHDFFIDKIKRVQAKFLAKHKGWSGAHQQHLERKPTEDTHSHHLPPAPVSKGLAVWRQMSQEEGNVVQKPIYFVWQTVDNEVRIAHREDAERQGSLDKELHTSEEALFYRSPSGKTLLAVFSHTVGSVMHSNAADLVMSFPMKRFKPFKVTIVNGETVAYLPVVKRFREWKIPFETDHVRSVHQPLVRAKPPYLALAEHLVDTGFRFLGDKEWLVVSGRDGTDHLRLELPFQP